MTLRSRNALPIIHSNQEHVQVKVKMTQKPIRNKKYRSGKTMETLKRIQKENDRMQNGSSNAAAAVQANMPQLVDEKENVDVNSSIISLCSDSSVEFVSEERPSSEVLQIARLNAQVADLKKQNQTIKLQYGALQQKIIANQAPIDLDCTEASVNDVSDIRLSNENILSDSFIDQQLNEWQQNNELDDILDEYSDFVENLN